MVALYDKSCDLTTIAGQYHLDLKILKVTSTQSCALRKCWCRPDFFLHFEGRPTKVSELVFNVEFNGEHTEIKLVDVELLFPFDEMRLQLDAKNSAVISTMCKDYSFRLDEWIRFNLQLGFSGIVVFDNDMNHQTTINEKQGISQKTAYHPDLLSTRQICERYKDKVHVISFPYSPLKCEDPCSDKWWDIGHWNVIQRITLTLGAHGLREKCKHIGFLDPDEFLYMTNNSSQSIEELLQKHDSVRVQHFYLTNKGYADFINNNVISLCKYGYLPTESSNKVDSEHMEGCKLLLATDQIDPYDFIVTPHKHPSAIEPIKVEELICFHCWVNERMCYKEDMEETNKLNEWFFQNGLEEWFRKKR